MVLLIQRGLAYFVLVYFIPSQNFEFLNTSLKKPLIISQYCLTPNNQLKVSVKPVLKVKYRKLQNLLEM